MKKRTFIKLSSAVITGSMISPVIDPIAIGWTQDDKLTNWAGNLIYSTNKLNNPISIEQVKNFIKTHNKFKVLGTKHCFNTIADSKNEFLSLSNLDLGITIDRDNLTVTVAAGIRYGQLAEYLYKNGFAVSVNS